MKKILVVVDMQKDFVNGSLGSKEAEAIIPNVIKKIKSYPIENIIVTLDTHFDNYMESQEGKFLPVVHCIKDTDGWRLDSRLKDILDGAKVFTKPTFGSVQLASYLSELNKQEEIEVELIGLCTDICVVSNALLIKAFLPEVKISVDASCAAGVTKEKHDAALNVMESCQIVINNK